MNNESLSTAFNFARDLYSSIPDEYKEAMKETLKDQVAEIITGKKTIDEWAEIAIKGVDNVKEYMVAEENLQYVGGKLCFQISDKNSQHVKISFHLYFLDENNEWKKTEAESDILASHFTSEALEELKEKGKVEFDVEG